MSALVLGDEPAGTCCLPDRRVFLRRLAADSGAGLLAAADAVLADPAAPWEDCGVRRTDGPAVLMDAGEAGAGPGAPSPDGGCRPPEAPVDVPAGRWRGRAVHATGGSARVGVVRLLPAAGSAPRPVRPDGAPGSGGRPRGRPGRTRRAPAARPARRG
ncbi:Imm21 family immunity protein [Kitasatospora sp. NPDC057500]|uniref:Imm21 family immunity protein n=1 Tax=Kitasatospora sp. NPDC057500 TaxID=3346151 RepID=UPI0036A1448F